MSSKLPPQIAISAFLLEVGLTGRRLIQCRNGLVRLGETMSCSHTDTGSLIMPNGLLLKEVASE
jgi:hypothetical protein